MGGMSFAPTVEMFKFFVRLKWFNVFSLFAAIAYSRLSVVQVGFGSILDLYLNLDHNWIKLDSTVY